MASAHLLFAFAVPGSLYVGSVILGISYGIHFSTMVPTASELFGLKHFGVIYNFLTMASPLGSFLFSGVITGYLYDQEAKKKIAPDARIVDTFLNNLHKNYDVQVLECIGAHCFKVTFIIMACVCGLGILVSIVLTIRIRRVYLSLYGPSTPPIQSTSDLKSSALNTHPPTHPSVSDRVGINGWYTQQKFSSDALFHPHHQQYNSLLYTVVWMKVGFNPDEGGFFFPPDEGDFGS